VGSQDDDDVVHRAAPDPFEHGLEQDVLLRTAEAPRGARGQNDYG
jgi:hypothetical protein